MQASLATELRDEKWKFVRKIEPVALVHPPIGPYRTNLQVRGEIEAAQMLLTPNVLQNPWQRDPKVLASWQK